MLVPSIAPWDLDIERIYANLQMEKNAILADIRLAYADATPAERGEAIREAEYGGLLTPDKLYAAFSKGGYYVDKEILNYARIIIDIIPRNLVVFRLPSMSYRERFKIG